MESIHIYANIYLNKYAQAQLARAVEYANYTINKCPGYNTKQSDGEAPVLEFWEMPSLRLLPCPFWPKVVVPVRVPSEHQIEIFNHLQY